MINDALLREAIRRHLVMEFHYDGVRRQVYPCVYGASKDGNALLRAWQVLGRPGTSPEWRTYTVAKIERPTTTGQTFQVGPLATGWHSSTMHTIYAQL